MKIGSLHFRETHRFSGKLWMASGILCMLCGLFWESIQIRCNDRDFNIEAKGWNDYTGSIRKLIAFLMKKIYCRTIMITELMVLETGSMLWKTSKTISSEIISATLMPPAIHMLP